MGVSTKNVLTALVYYDGNNSDRWLDALGSDVVKYILGPGSAVAESSSEFVVTLVEGGAGESTIVNSATVGNSLLLTTDAAEYDGLNVQLRGEAFKIETDKPLYFGIKVTASEATNADLLVGLCETNTALLATSSAHAIGASNIEGIFFTKIDGGTSIVANVYKDNALTGSATYGTAFSTSATIFEWYFDGTTLYASVNGNVVGSFTDGFPDGDLTPSINFRAGSTDARTLQVAWLRAIEIRG